MIFLSKLSNLMGIGSKVVLAPKLRFLRSHEEEIRKQLASESIVAIRNERLLDIWAKKIKIKPNNKISRCRF